MSNVLVLYKSKYGSAKKYAEMLRDELVCHCCEIDAYRENSAEMYDWVIFAGGIYAGGISGLNSLRKKCKDSKRLVIFCVGASPYDEKAFDAVKAHNLKGDFKDVPVFYGRGAWDESRMSWKDRTMCRILQKAVEKRPPESLEPWMMALLSASGQSCDWTDKEYLLPLVSYIKSKS